MQSDNYMIKALAFDKKVRIFFVENTELMRAICDKPEIGDRLLKTALGTTITAASLLTGTLKGSQRLSIKVKASHPDRNIFADADAEGNIRGYLGERSLQMPYEQREGLALAQWIGSTGCLQIVKDDGRHHSFTGITDMPYGNIVDDVAHYFQQSEQTPTRLGIHIEFNENHEIRRSRGILAQLLPGSSAQRMDDIQRILDRQPGFRSPSEQLTPERARAVLASLFDDIAFVGQQPLQAYCGCSKPMFYPMLLALGEDALERAREERQHIEMVCHACGNKYVFEHDEL